jgi:hypothetical protein
MTSDNRKNVATILAAFGASGLIINGIFFLFFGGIPFMILLLIDIAALILAWSLVK